MAWSREKNPGGNSLMWFSSQRGNGGGVHVIIFCCRRYLTGFFFFSFFFRTCKMSFKYLNSGVFFFNLLVTHNFFHSDFSQHFKKNLHAHSGLNLTNTWHRQKTKPPLMYSTVLSAFTSMNYRKYFLPQGKEQDPTFKVWNGNAWLLFSRLPT